LPEALLHASGVFAGYRGAAILRGVDLSVHESRIELVVGPNGAGKSTLVKAVIGELPLLGGRIRFDGDDISGWDEERRAARGIGYIPQTRDVFPTLTVVENLEVGGYRLSRRACREAVTAMLERFPHLRALRHRRASQLSGGERKQLAIARALMADPKLLILDEPTAGLAPKIAHSVLEELVVGLAELGRGLLLIEQRVALAAAIASHVTVLVDGAVRYAADGDEFRAIPDPSALFFSTAAAGGQATAPAAKPR